MLLRPRQEKFVSLAREGLAKHGNTLGVAPTGFGKTVAISAVVGQEMPIAKRALVLQHRDELVAQNRAAWHKLWGLEYRTSVIDGSIRDPNGQVIYGMVKSVANNLDILPDDIGMVATDETHHSAAKTYGKVYDYIKERTPMVRFFGVTATPERGDKKALTAIYNNVCDVVTLGEIIRAGNLVRPRAMVIDIGVQADLTKIKRAAADFDQKEVEEIMDKAVHHEAVINHWRANAGNRQTVVFASTVAHSKHTVEAFKAAGINAEHIDGETSKTERRRLLQGFDRGDFQVLSNVSVLTEGWDCQPVSCVVLLRRQSHPSTMIQMVGRGLRKQDPERYPGRAPKNDAVILDFGTSLLEHGSLDVDVMLEHEKGKPKTKLCPECASEVPMSCRYCPLCQHEFPVIVSDRLAPELVGKDGLDNFVMTEIDILNASPFRWETLYDSTVMVATSFSAWAMAVFYHGSWYSVGGSQEKGVHVLEAGCASSLQAIASADDWMRTHGKAAESGKAKQWLLEPASDKMLNALRVTREQANYYGITKYKASCQLTWEMNQAVVKSKVMQAARSAAT
mgnify:FL=1